MLSSPAFGKADLTNCERELIHLAGSVQPHGVLIALREPQLRILQLSANAEIILGVPIECLLHQPVSELGGDIETCVRHVAAAAGLADPAPLRCKLPIHGATQLFEGTMHRVGADVLLVEIEPVGHAKDGAKDGARDVARGDAGAVAGAGSAIMVDIPNAQLLELLNDAVQRFSSTSTIGTLADSVVRAFRDMFGYDRCMVYKFDPDGHGKIIAEARDPRLDSLLGHHYPASDIPQRARELYIRNRLRVLVDVNYEPAPLVPRQLPGSHEELDMSMCHLRSMSPLHLQYLKNMGVTATLVVSLAREGKLWGLIACHHYSARNLRFALRSAADLMAEVVSTRIAAIDNYAHAQVAIQVRRLEQRLVEATSTEGDWRLALFRNPRTLLQPLDATAAALFYDGELLTAGEAPSTPELRHLIQWIDRQPFDGIFSCSAVGRDNPALDSLTPTASGVLAVKLSASKPDYLVWFRKEQLLSVTWAGDPTKPVVGNDPMELSPRRSFAAWSEIVRGTAVPWSPSELALARAFGDALIDIIVQINAVRLLIAEHQLAQIRETVSDSKEPVVIADAQHRVLFANAAFARLLHQADTGSTALPHVAELFADPVSMRKVLTGLAHERRAWRGEQSLAKSDGTVLAVAVRAEVVPARDGSVLGFFFVFTDLTGVQRAAEARRHLEQSLHSANAADGIEGGVARDGMRTSEPTERGDLMGAILANASLAAMDIADGNTAPSVAPLLEELEASTRRATELYGRIRTFGG
ncbi:GAF domain-containing protein [soil metagenome]